MALLVGSKIAEEAAMLETSFCTRTSLLYEAGLSELGLFLTFGPGFPLLAGCHLRTDASNARRASS